MMKTENNIFKKQNKKLKLGLVSTSADLSFLGLANYSCIYESIIEHNKKKSNDRKYVSNDCYLIPNE